MFEPACLFHKLKNVAQSEQCPTKGRCYFLGHFWVSSNCALRSWVFVGRFLWACQGLLVRLSVIIQAHRRPIRQNWTDIQTDRQTDTGPIRHKSQSHEDRYAGKTSRVVKAKLVSSSASRIIWYFVPKLSVDCYKSRCWIICRWNPVKRRKFGEPNHFPMRYIGK